jgi:hypothetical protein
MYREKEYRFDRNWNYRGTNFKGIGFRRESAYKERGSDRHDPLSRTGARGMKGGIVWE